MDKKKSPTYFRGTDSAEVIPVIRTRAMRGAGTPEDPFREVTQYWSLQGEFLCEADPYFAEGIDSASSNVSSQSM